MVIASAAALYLLLGGGGSQGDQRGAGRDGQMPASISGESDALARLEGEPTRSATAAPGEQRTWRVEVRAPDGSSVDTAKIEAKRTFGGGALSATGSARWPNVQSGAWSLVVTAEGYPVWRRRVEIDADESRVTVAQLGTPYRVIGRVVDAERAPKEAHFVGFLPVGAPEPRSAIEWLDLPNARTDRDGAFAAEINEVGRYRMFVGYGGRIVLLDSQVLEAVSGSIASVQVVIPVPTKMLIEGRDAGTPSGSLDPANVYAVSIYRRDEIMDLERPLPPQPDGTRSVDLDDPTLDEETRAELERVVEAEKARIPEEELARRRAVVPDGWRVDRSGVMPSDRPFVLEGLPAGEELRFAARRGGEVFRVNGSATVHPTAVTRVVLAWPSSPDAPEEGVREVEVSSTIDPARERIPVGATWELSR